MKIAVAQLDLELGNKEHNLNHIIRYVEEASDKGAGLILFPEMCDTGYEMQTITSSPSSKGDAFYTALAGAAQSYDITIVIGISDSRDGDIYNTQMVFSKEGTTACQYDKIHLFTAEPIREHATLYAGNHLTAFKENAITFGLQICYDLRFPELSRSLALKGSQVLLISAAWPQARREHWQALLKARAIENQCYVIASNRCGIDAGLTFAGSSAILSPTGTTISAQDDSEGLIYGEIDTGLIEETRKTIAVFGDRRSDLYDTH